LRVIVVVTHDTRLATHHPGGDACYELLFLSFSAIRAAK